MAAIGSTPLERVDEAEGVLIVTVAADKGLVDIHDRRPLVLVPDAAREWMKQGVSGKEAEDMAADGAVSADHLVISNNDACAKHIRRFAKDVAAFGEWQLLGLLRQQAIETAIFGRQFIIAL